MNPFDTEGEIVNIEMMNPNLSFKSLKSGDRFILSVEIKQEVWEQLRSCNSRLGMLLDADVTIVALNTDLGGIKSPSEHFKEKHEHRPDSPANMLHKSFLGLPEFQEYIALRTLETIESEDDCKAVLKRYYDIGSLSEITMPQMGVLMQSFKKFCDDKE